MYWLAYWFFTADEDRGNTIQKLKSLQSNLAGQALRAQPKVSVPVYSLEE